MGKIITFSSFLHGSGRTTLMKALEKYLKDKGYKVLSISVGRVFREIAAKEGKSIDDFVKELEENFELDMRIDKEIYEKVMKNKNKYDYILVDSNLAPYYIKDSIKVLVSANIDIIAERILKNKRFGDKDYKSKEEAKKEILDRSKRDKERYKKIAESIDDEFWRNVYLSYYEEKDIFDIKINNNKELKEVIKDLINKLKEKKVI